MTMNEYVLWFIKGAVPLVEILLEVYSPDSKQVGMLCKM